jgi:hypothetical protein
MANEREIKTNQEDRLFDNFLSQKLLKEGKTDKLSSYLSMMGEKAQSGMTAEEIDAVRERVNRAIANI